MKIKLVVEIEIEAESVYEAEKAIGTLLDYCDNVVMYDFRDENEDREEDEDRDE